MESLLVIFFLFIIISIFPLLAIIITSIHNNSYGGMKDFYDKIASGSGIKIYDIISETNSDLNNNGEKASQIIQPISLLGEIKHHNTNYNVRFNKYYKYDIEERFEFQITPKNKYYRFDFNINCKTNKNNLIKPNEKDFFDFFYYHSSDEKKLMAVLNSQFRLYLIKLYKCKAEVSIKENTLTVNILFKINKKNNIDFPFINNIIKELLDISNDILSVQSIDKIIKKNIIFQSNDNIRIKNMEAFINNSDPQVLKDNEDFFKSLINNESKMISIMACYCLGEEGITKLINYLTVDNYSFTLIVIDYLKRYWNDKDVLKEFYKLLETNNKNIIIKIIEIFTEIKDFNSINIILNYFNNNKESIESLTDFTIAIIKYFGALKVTKSIEWLVKVINNKKNLFDFESNDLIVNVINALGEIGDTKSIEHILPFTKGIQIDKIKKAAINAIKSIQSNIPDNMRGNLDFAFFDDKGNLSLENEEQGKLSIDKE